MHILVKTLAKLAVAAPNAADWYDDDCDDDWYPDCGWYRGRRYHDR